MDSFGKVEAAASLLFPHLKMTKSTEIGELKQTIIKMDFRAFINLQKHIKFVPVLNFLLASGSNDYTDKINSQYSYNSDLNSQQQMLLGLGVQYEKDNYLLSGGPSLMLAKETEHAESGSNYADAENTVSAILWNFGAEVYCTNWLTARLGYKTITGSVTMQEPLNNKKVNERSFYNLW